MLFRGWPHLEGNYAVPVRVPVANAAELRWPDLVGCAFSGRWPFRSLRRAFARTSLCTACAALLFLVTAITGDLLASDAQTARHLRGLRDRQLHAVAEALCAERLRSGRLTVDEEIDWTIELARTQHEQALLGQSKDPGDVSAAAQRLLTDLAERPAAKPRSPEIRTEAALLAAEWADLLQQEAELAPESRQQNATAIAKLQEVETELKLLDKELGKIPTDALSASRTNSGSKDRSGKDRGSKANAAGDPGNGKNAAATGDDNHAAEMAKPLTLFERENLRARLRFRLTETQVGGAMLRRPTDPERVALLRDAATLLKPLTDGDDAADQVWASRVLLLRVYRLQGDFPRVERTAAQLENLSPPAAIRNSILAERARVLQLQSRLDAADRLLGEALRTASGDPGELYEARVAVAVDRWQDAQRKKQFSAAADVETQIKEFSRLAASRSPGYWSRRCDRVAARIVADGEYGVDAGPAVRTAEAAIQSGAIDEGIAIFDRAATGALERGETTVAAKIRFMTASVELQQNRWESAARRFETYAVDQPSNDRAADAHLLAAFARGKLYEAHASRSRREKYEELLRAQQSKFAGHPTAGEAAWMLGQHFQGRGQITAALPEYQKIGRDHPRWPATVAAVNDCQNIAITRLRAAGESFDRWQADAIKWLESAIGADAEKSTNWATWQADAAVRLGRQYLDRQPPDERSAEKWLSRAAEWCQSGRHLSNAVKADASRLQTVLRRLRIVSLAKQGQLEQARELANQLGEISPADLLSVIGGLSAVAPDSEPRLVRDLAELEYTLAVQLDERRNELAQADRRQLDLSIGRCLMLTGRSAVGIERIRRLLSENTRDLALHETLGESLLEWNMPESIELAVELFRKLTKLRKPGSNEWLRARLMHCRALAAQGANEDCLKLVSVTKLLYPQLAGTVTGREFDALETQVAGSAKP